jgi:Flp pilus assembly protein TadG
VQLLHGGGRSRGIAERELDQALAPDVALRAFTPERRGDRCHGRLVHSARTSYKGALSVACLVRIKGRRNATHIPPSRQRHDRRHDALVGPIVLLVLLGITVCGIAVANQDLLSNGVRDAARAAAVCGGNIGGSRDTKTQLPAAGAVASAACSWSQFDTYTQARLTELAGGKALSAPTGGTNCLALPSNSALVCLYDNTNTAKVFTGNPLDSCQVGYKIEVSAKYAQPLYLPLVPCRRSR